VLSALEREVSFAFAAHVTLRFAVTSISGHRFLPDIVLQLFLADTG
jgi:hypothetical protein